MPFNSCCFYSLFYVLIVFIDWFWRLKFRFGGGPAITELHYCLICQNEYQIIKRKREIELKAFLTLEEQLKRLKSDMSSLTYGYYLPPNVIAKAWIDKWKAFVEESDFGSF